MAKKKNKTSDGLIVREKEPACLEFPFETLDSFLTPNEKFFIRNHFKAPTIRKTSWRLTVEGSVRESLDLGYKEILQMPSRTLVTTLESAGNGRAFVPEVEGIPWEMGAVGTAEWTGVPLAHILEMAGADETAAEVVLEGSDCGKVHGEGAPGEAIHYARSLPMTKALYGDVILAYQMNGEDLPREHGFPLRAIVPAWYAESSVKWLSRIIVSDKRFDGYFQTMSYTFMEPSNGKLVRLPVAEMQVKAEISRPFPHEVVPAASRYRIHGAAWTGDADVAAVEVSTNGGLTWINAELTGDSVRYAWRLWEYDWHTPGQPGKYTIYARAIDSKGHVQSMTHDPHRGCYMISHTLPVEVEVR